MASRKLGKAYGERSIRRDGPFGLRYYTIIYAIHAPASGRIKLGRTMNIERRFSSLCASSPQELVLLGHCWMPDDAEAEIHAFLKEDRCHGEWFTATERVRSIAALIAAKKDTDLARALGMDRMIPEHVPSGVSWGAR